METIDYNHVILYAKGWYKKTDLVNDLAIILGKRSNIDPDYFIRKPADINSQLLPIVWQLLQQTPNPAWFFTDFVEDIAPENQWKIGGLVTHSIFGGTIPGKEPEEHHIRVLRSILAVFRHASIIKGGQTILELGEPDPDILPLSGDGEERIERKGSLEAV